MKPTIEATELDSQQLEQLLDQIEETMGEQTARPLRILLSGYLTVLRLLEEKTITLRRLRRLLGFSSERTSKVVPSGENASEDSEPNDSDNSDANDSDQPPASDRRRPGHGRNPAAAYVGCELVAVTHEGFCQGDACPDCGVGTLYRQSEWAQVVRLTGRPPVGGVRYKLERLRCGTCGKVQTAELPEEAGPAKYDPSVASVIAVFRYGLGMPHTRIEQVQQAAGVPLPCATQWDLVKAAIERGIGAVYRQLLVEAAQGELIHNDDTSMQILELTARLQKGQPLRMDDPSRTGVFTTNILSRAEGRPDIGLFFTGPWHSGENLRELLKRRLTDLPPPLQMCDGLSRNMPADLQMIVANCLVHARRNFCEVSNAFPLEVRHVLECLKLVYQHDAKAKRLGLSPEERLRFHQQHSGPVMQRLHQWLQARLDERLVEPNSPLGQAVSYMLRHWEKLTRFLHVAGAPLDNNICERALKLAIRHRKNSLFYKTQHGAGVGDMYMSLTYTCRSSSVNPLDYLTQLQHHEEQVNASPELWLPWNYREQFNSE